MTDFTRIDMESDEFFMSLYKVIKPISLTSMERQWGLYQAIKHIVANEIDGDIVECGVYKGGSMLLAAKTLYELDDLSSTFWLYDTYEGMTEPSEDDIAVAGVGADHFYKAGLKQPLDVVKATMAQSNYPAHRIRYVAGDVRETLSPKSSEPRPSAIALLRLDTDWYDSTLVELQALYNRVVPGGVIIADDYGHWLGQRKAIEEFFSERDEHPLWHRLDYSGRMMVKH